ncbi:hypothetical protein FE236_00295 [Mariprofundus erugo]|uniref:hypothetical protein n=1 Tax=Mariprofundus erugo TaxID=2528639 RepID=UPI0010FD1BE6|nr:hypothetical protein [Mariprofundus erugo]TLS78233.1 hypothetical protein FE236_00295 [Mariprofundus erugo]
MPLIVRDVDPARFNDPLAMRVSWQPMQPGGANHRRLRLRWQADGGLAFRPAFVANAAPILFLGWSCLLLLVLLFTVVDGGGIGIGEVVAAACALLFLLIGLWFWRARPISHHFDVAVGVYRYGRATPLPLANIHALQMIGQEVRPNLALDINQRHFHSYELNLVLSDGTRRPLVNQSGVDRLRLEAGELAAALGVPLWDGSQGVGDGGTSYVFPV